MGWHGRSYHKSYKLIIAHYKQRSKWPPRQTVAKERIIADSWPGSSYGYRDMGSFCHHVFKQNVIPAIGLSFWAPLSQPCKKSSDRSSSCCTLLSSYMPAHFPTYFNLCLTVAHITLNCALWNSARKSLSVIFGVWMCPWGVVCVQDRPIHFTFVSHRLLYSRGSRGFHAAQRPVFVQLSISFI